MARICTRHKTCANPVFRLRDFDHEPPVCIADLDRVFEQTEDGFLPSQGSPPVARRIPVPSGTCPARAATRFQGRSLQTGVFRFRRPDRERRAWRTLSVPPCQIAPRRHSLGRNPSIEHLPPRFPGSCAAQLRGRSRGHEGRNGMLAPWEEIGRAIRRTEARSVVARAKRPRNPCHRAPLLLPAEVALPNPQHSPAPLLECLGDVLVAGSVASDLLRPESAPSARNSAPRRVAVPEVAIDEERQPLPRKHEIGPPEYPRIPSPANDAMCPEQGHHSEFRGTVAFTPDGRHDPRPLRA